MKRSPLERRTPLKRGSGLARTTAPKPKRSGFTPASKEQRAKVKASRFVLRRHADDPTNPVHQCYREDGRPEPIDPMHLTPRSKGGCDHPDCIVAAGRFSVHKPYDDGYLDLLTFFADDSTRKAFLPELQHMLEHLDPVSMIEQLANARTQWRG